MLPVRLDPLTISQRFNQFELSEVAFVGKSPGVYLMLLGGGYYGQRLNKIYRGGPSSPRLSIHISSH
jgi:sulfite reductase beta subunit-like hemoprotein